MSSSSASSTDGDSKERAGSADSGSDEDRDLRKEKKRKREKKESRKKDRKEKKEKDRKSKSKKEKRDKKDKKDKDKRKDKPKDDEKGVTSPTAFKMSEFFEKEDSGELYSAISGKRIKRSIERTDDDIKFEQERQKKLEKLNQKFGDEGEVVWGKSKGFDPSKLKDPKVDKFMMNMKLCNTLAYSGFDPKAEAKKQSNRCVISFPQQYG